MLRKKKPGVALSFGEPPIDILVRHSSACGENGTNCADDLGNFTEGDLTYRLGEGLVKGTAHCHEFTVVRGITWSPVVS